MKIAIIGNPGSGKSTLSLKLHTQLDIPLYHLDQYQWQSGWQKVPLELFKHTHNELCDKDQWIIEGCGTKYIAYRLDKADMIIFLDMPRYVCLYRVFKRAFTHFGKEFFSSAKGCKERFPSFKFLYYLLWRFPQEKRPKILELLTAHETKKKVSIIKNQNELNRLLLRLKAHSGKTND